MITRCVLRVAQKLLELNDACADAEDEPRLEFSPCFCVLRADLHLDALIAICISS
jgi:hypothetical protein